MLKCGLWLAKISTDFCSFKRTTARLTYPVLLGGEPVFSFLVPRWVHIFNAASRVCRSTVVSSFSLDAGLGAGLRPLPATTRKRRRQRGTLHLDTFVRTLLVRFLTRLWGQPVLVSLMRNLQLRLADQELVFLFLQNQRIFIRMPGAVNTPRLLQTYA